MSKDADHSLATKCRLEALARRLGAQSSSEDFKQTLGRLLGIVDVRFAIARLARNALRHNR
jgi:hypothetical protein